MVIKIVENSVKNLGLPLLVFDNFDTSFINCKSDRTILAFFDDSIPNITGIPPLEYEKILIYRKFSQPLKGFNHYIKKPFLPTEIVQFIKPKIPQDILSSQASSINDTPVHTTQAIAELAAIAESLDSESLEPTELSSNSSTKEQAEPLAEIPIDETTLNDNTNFINLPDSNSFDDLGKPIVSKIQEDASPKKNTDSTEETTLQSALSEGELLDFDAIFDQKDDGTKIALDEVDTDDFLKRFELEDLHSEHDTRPQNIQVPMESSNSESTHKPSAADSTEATQILNPKDIDEIKRLLQETAIHEIQAAESNPTEQPHINPTLTAYSLETSAFDITASSSIPSDMPDTPYESQSPQEPEGTPTFDTQSNPAHTPANDSANPVSQEDSFSTTPHNIREHLDKDLVSALKSIERDIANLNIDEGEILEALNQNAKNLQTPSAPQAQSLSCSGAEFIELIKNTPSKELQKLFGNSKILLEIDFSKQ